MSPKARRSTDRLPRRPRLPAVEEASPRPQESPTAVAAEMLRTGVKPSPLTRRDRNNGLQRREAEAMRAGDPDDSAIINEYVGDEIPGGSSPTPDQNNVDAIGRAYGLQEEDAGPLRSTAEILGRRDRHRSELVPPRRRRL